MIVFIQILLIAFLVAFPIMHHVKKARIEFSIVLAMMFGISLERQDLVSENTLFERWDLTFCFGPLYIVGTWMNNVGPSVDLDNQ